MPAPLQRLEEKYITIPETDCWWWTASLNNKGYGQFWLEGKMWRAHRASWELHVGGIPEGMCVLHKCDNPTCINPEHLFLGTQLENIEDRDTKGRQVAGTSLGERHGMTSLTESQVLDIRAMYKTGRYKQKTLADQYGLTKATAHNIIKGKTWSHLPI